MARKRETNYRVILPKADRPHADPLTGYAGWVKIRDSWPNLVRDDGKITVKAGDSLSKFASAIYGDSGKYQGEFGRLVNDGMKPISATEYIYPEEEIYHIKTYDIYQWVKTLDQEVRASKAPRHEIPVGQARRIPNLKKNVSVDDRLFADWIIKPGFRMAGVRVNNAVETWCVLAVTEGSVCYLAEPQHKCYLMKLRLFREQIAWNHFATVGKDMMPLVYIFETGLQIGLGIVLGIVSALSGLGLVAVLAFTATEFYLKNKEPIDRAAKALANLFNELSDLYSLCPVLSEKLMCVICRATIQEATDVKNWVRAAKQLSPRDVASLVAGLAVFVVSKRPPKSWGAVGAKVTNWTGVRVAILAVLNGIKGFLIKVGTKVPGGAADKYKELADQWDKSFPVFRQRLKDVGCEISREEHQAIFKCMKDPKKQKKMLEIMRALDKEFGILQRVAGQFSAPKAESKDGVSGAAH